ncbi:MAG: hypothetical protein FJZ08_03675 [Candidatus Omnitrophica bacterium]|nr:hypothetical protein [Candidatus Omnitrophota bacterium]
MDRKDVYDHLAKIYLDASSKTKRKKRHKDNTKITQAFFVAGALALLSLMLVFLISARKSKELTSEIALIFAPEAVKINFNFDPAKKESYSLKLNNVNFKHFKVLAFSVRKASPGGNVSLRVELTNSFKEKSEVYLNNISEKWRDYRVNLIDFKGVSSWSKVAELAFIVEEWNASSKKGIVYVDNIRLLK